MADEMKIRAELKSPQSSRNAAIAEKLELEDKKKDTIIPQFLHNGRFSALTFLCGLPLLYFGGERLFGVSTICLLAVYILHVTFNDTKSSLIGYVIAMVVMQLSILYCISPLLWHSLFNIILLFIYNIFIILTGGLGLIQFEQFRKHEIAFCANVEYFMFLVYPPICLLILVWMSSLTFGSYLAPYLFIIIGFPICHTFLDPKIKCSFNKSDYILGQPEKLLVIFIFIVSPPFSYFLVNFTYLLQYSSLVAMFFLVSMPFFLVTFLDTTDLRDLADINNIQWQLLQLTSGCFSMMFGNLLIYLQDVVDGLHSTFLTIILLCSTMLFVTIKYRYSYIVSFISSIFLLFSYLGWFYFLPWNLIFSMGATLKMSFFTIELLISILGVLSVVIITISTSVTYKQYLNQILVLHTIVFVVVEEVLNEAGNYSVYMMMATSSLMFYMIQRLYLVHLLSKMSSLLCLSLHGAKLVVLATTTALQDDINTVTLVGSVVGGLVFSSTLTSIMLFEHKRRIQRQMALFYSGSFLFSLIILSPNLRWLWIMGTHQEPSFADGVGLVLVLTGVFVAKVTFLHMNDRVPRKQSILLLVLGVIIITTQPYFNFFEIISHIPKLIFREVLYKTWQVVLAEFMILPWCLLISVTIILVQMLKLLSLKELSLLSLNILSFLIGAPIGLFCAHLVLPYPEVSSSFLSVPYMLSASFTANSLLLISRDKIAATSTIKYLAFLFVSVISVAVEINMNVNITIAEAPLLPSILFHGILHAIKIMELSPRYDLKTSMDTKKSSFPNITYNISLAFIFMCGFWFTPRRYQDILLVPFFGCLLLLKTRDLIKTSKKEFFVNMIIFVGVLSSVLYYRVLTQFTLGKISFWILVGFILEFSFLAISFSVIVIIISVFWQEKMSSLEERCLVFLSPGFIFLLFYGRTTAGQVLGIVGPVLSYYTFYYPFT